MVDAERMKLSRSSEAPQRLTEAKTGAPKRAKSLPAPVTVTPVRPLARPSRQRVADARELQRRDEERARAVVEAQFSAEAPADPPRNPERERALRKVVRQSLGRPSDLAAAAAGLTELGPVLASEHADLIRGAVEGWRDAGALQVGVGSLEAGTLMFPATAKITSSTLAELAAEGAQPGQTTRRQDADTIVFADAAIRSAPDAASLRGTLDEVGPGLAWGLQLSSDQYDLGRGPGRDRRVSSAVQLLGAAATGPAPNETTALTTQVLFEGARASDYRLDARLPEAMGRALGRHWHPDDAEQARVEGERFAGLLGTDAGADVLGRSEVPDAARARALATLREDPSLVDTLAAYKDGPGWTEPELNRRLAKPRAATFLETRGNEPKPLEGSALVNTVGASMGLTPHIPEDETPEARDDREAKLDLDGQDHFSAGPDGEAIDRVVEAIEAVGGEPAEVTVLPLQFSSPGTGPVDLPLFRVQDKDSGEDRFVDNLGRRYASFEDWRENNKLPPGNLVVPSAGHLRRGREGEVALTSENTHATVDTLGERAWQVVDTAVLVGGVVAGGAIVMGSGGTAAPLVVAGASAYGAAQYADGLHDRATHGQTLSLANFEARSMWLGLGANALGFSALGSSIRAGKIAALGRDSAALNRFAYGSNIGAYGADSAAIANSAHALATRWDELPPSERASRALEMAFFGVSIPARRQLGADARTARASGPLKADLRPDRAAGPEEAPSGTPGTPGGLLGDTLDATLDGLGRMENGRFPRVDPSTHSLLRNLEPDRPIVIERVSETGSVRTDTMTVGEALLAASGSGMLKSLRVLEVPPRETPRATLDQVRDRFDGDWIEGMDPSQGATVSVEMQSGLMARFTGTPEMMMELAKDPLVVRISGRSAVEWAPHLDRVPRAHRTADYDPVSAHIDALGPVTIGHPSDVVGLRVHHGSLRGMEESVRAGPRDVGKGFGGSGLYLALDGDLDIASSYAHMAREAAEVRAAQAGLTNVDSTPVVLSGTIAPNPDLRVGRFSIVRDGAPDLEKGVLPFNWADDPSLQAALLQRFDVLDVRGMQSAGLNLATDRILVLHASSGPDAVQWAEGARRPFSVDVP